MTITVTLRNEHALRVLEELERKGELVIEPNQVTTAPAQPKLTFDAMRVDTRGFRFNRDEANER